MASWEDSQDISPVYKEREVEIITSAAMARSIVQRA